MKYTIDDIAKITKPVSVSICPGQAYFEFDVLGLSCGFCMQLDDSDHQYDIIRDHDGTITNLRNVANCSDLEADGIREHLSDAPRFTFVDFDGYFDGEFMSAVYERVMIAHQYDVFAVALRDLEGLLVEHAQ